MGNFFFSLASSRLQQRNPSSIRHADFDLGEQSFEMDIEILFNEKISSIFPHLKENCDQNELLAENQNYDRNDSNQRNNHRIFANAKDLQLWTNGIVIFVLIDSKIFRSIVWLFFFKSFFFRFIHSISSFELKIKN